MDLGSLKRFELPPSPGQAVMKSKLIWTFQGMVMYGLVTWSCRELGKLDLLSGR